jgi:probable rRNA maturation factor
LSQRENVPVARLGAMHGRTASSPPRKNRITIEFANRQRLCPVDDKEIRAVTRLALQAEGVRQAHIEIALTDDQEIRQINRQFLGLDSATDVLSFPLNERGEALTGVIVISVQTARRAAPEYGKTIRQEVLLYIIHGVLHLCGYDDRTPRAARQMGRRQLQLLNRFTSSERTRA